MALVTDPTYPVAGELVTLSLTATTGNVAEYTLTVVPDASELATGDLVDGNGDPVATFTPDVDGEYNVTAYEFSEFYRPARFAGDATAGAGRRKLRATQTGVVNVGTYVDLPIVTALGHGMTLRLTVNDTTVRAATLVEPTTDVAQFALVNAERARASYLTDLVGSTVTAIGEDFITGVTELRTKFEAHRILTAGAVHAMADSVDAMVAYAPVSSVPQAIVVLNELHERLTNHMLTGTTGTRWHAGGDDTKNTPVVGKAHDLASATVLLADLKWRCYNRHRAQIATPAAHGAADNTNTLAAVTKLSTLILSVLDAIIAASPGIVSGENTGARQAAHIYGFREHT